MKPEVSEPASRKGTTSMNMPRKRVLNVPSVVTGSLTTLARLATPMVISTGIATMRSAAQPEMSYEVVEVSEPLCAAMWSILGRHGTDRTALVEAVDGDRPAGDLGATQVPIG